jgi:hypothetical protein
MEIMHSRNPVQGDELQIAPRLGLGLRGLFEGR